MSVGRDQINSSRSLPQFSALATATSRPRGLASTNRRRDIGGVRGQGKEKPARARRAGGVRHFYYEHMNIGDGRCCHFGGEVARKRKKSISRSPCLFADRRSRDAIFALSSTKRDTGKRQCNRHAVLHRDTSTRLSETREREREKNRIAPVSILSSLSNSSPFHMRFSLFCQNIAVFGEISQKFFKNIFEKNFSQLFSFASLRASLSNRVPDINRSNNCSRVPSFPSALTKLHSDGKGIANISRI